MSIAEKIFEVQGNYGEIQCEKGCHDKVYDNYEIIKKMIENIDKNLNVASNLIPKCPVCGGNMVPHLRVDRNFVQNEAWGKFAQEYLNFLKEIKNKKVIFLELGVGYNTPAIIRFPFEKMVMKSEGLVTLIRFNRDYPQGIKVNEDRTITFIEDIRKVLEKL